MLFGLSANPPTGRTGHAGLVAWAASEARLDEWDGAGPDEVWVLPVYRHAFAAKGDLAPFDHRMEMARLAFERLPGAEGKVRVIDVERRVHEAMVAQDPSARPGTIDVVRWLRAEHPEAVFALLLGADTYRDLLAGRWRQGDELMKLVVVVAVPRKGVSLNEDTRPGAPELDEVSSTVVRDDVDSWSSALDPEVLAYIRKHGLYAAGRVDGSSA